jgi:mRNA interferase MazF
MVSVRKPKQFEIYWANLDPVVGSEIQKTRPCIVVSPDIMNNLLNTVMVIPLTKTIIDWPFRQSIEINGEKSSAACDHLRSISTTRLGNKIAALDPNAGNQLLECLRAIFDRA